MKLFTSEAVTEGHPDKVCDQIADRILDELLEQDPESRCACEVTAEPGAVHIMGEITTRGSVDYEKTAREVIRKIGYTDEAYGFTDQCRITCTIHAQSPDIAMGVDRSYESKEAGSKALDLGAGDQGMMYGYACNETPEFMPAAAQMANTLARHLAELRKNGTLPWLRPDGKTQVTMEYENGKPTRIHTLVVSAQHDPEVDLEEIRAALRKNLFTVIPGKYIDADTRFFINPTGRFVLGGPAADTGLTGRKIIADTYGGYARHGGGSFSGKDPTKVDRSAAYMARFIAKHVVMAGLADRCELQLAYAIGVARPVSISVDTFGTAKAPEEMIEKTIEENLDLRPAAIIQRLNLRRPIYAATSVYGHFGKAGLPWEEPDEAFLAKLKSLRG